MIIRIPKKYADNFENRLYRYLRAGFNPKNLFNFYKKSNKFPYQNPSSVPPSVAPDVTPKRYPQRCPQVYTWGVASRRYLLALLPALP